MAKSSSDQTLMALLALEDDAVAPGDVQPARLPTLDERADMFLRAIHGPNVSITAEMHAAARDRLLTAMAEELVEATGGRLAGVDNSATAEAPQLAAVTAPVESGGTSLWAALVAGFARLGSLAADALTIRAMRMAAVPLLALLVVGTVLTGNWVNQSELPVPGNPAPDKAAGAGTNDQTPRMRGIEPTSRDSDAERALKHEIAASEATLGPTHPTVGRLLVDLAAIYRLEGRTQEAEPLCVRGLTTLQQALGPKDPDVIRARAELAAIYRAEGRTKDADDLIAHPDRR